VFVKLTRFTTDDEDKSNSNEMNKCKFHVVRRTVLNNGEYVSTDLYQSRVCCVIVIKTSLKQNTYTGKCYLMLVPR